MRYLTILFLVVFSACESEKVDPGLDSLGLSYFPLQENAYWIYQVSSEQIESDDTQEVQDYQLRYSIQEQAIPGSDSFLLSVDIRSDESNEWKLKETWRVWRNNRHAGVNIGSLSFLKLTFPIEEGRIWNGNSLNALQEETYLIDSLNRTFTFADMLYENTLTVFQQYNVDPVQVTTDSVQIEVYALNKGLVYKENTFVKYKNCGSNDECCGSGGREQCFGEVNQGFKYTQYLLETNVE